MGGSEDKPEERESSSQASYALSELNALNAEIAALAQARLPLESQLRRLGKELLGRSGELATRLSARLESGQSLQAALDAEGDRVPGAYRAVVFAGLKSGRLAAALEALSESATRLDQLRRVTGVALLYPLIIIIVTWTLMAIAFWGIVPAFSWFDRAGSNPWSESLTATQNLSLAALSVATGALGVFCYWWWQTGRGTFETSGSALGRAPLSWIARVKYFGEVATFAEILRLLVHHDVPLPEALVTAADTTSHQPTRRAARELAAACAAGREVNLEPALARCFPPLVGLALRQADNRALMESALRQANTIYTQRAEHSSYWATEYLPILLMASLGGIAAAALMFVVLWPYVAMIRELSGPFWW